MAKTPTKAGAATDAKVVFMQSCLLRGEKRGEVLAKAVKKWRITPRTFDRLWNVAKSEYKKAQQAVNAALEAQRVESETEALKRDIMTVNERKEILSKIARGEIPLRKAMVVDGAIEYIDIVPDWMDRKNAIAELNKMEGDYAPNKIEHTVSNVSVLSIDPLANVIDDTSNHGAKEDSITQA